VRVGLKLPDNLRHRAVSIGELGRESIQWYKDHAKRDLYTFSNRMELIIRELGSRPADAIKPKDIEDWLARHSEWAPATKNRYKTVLSKAYQLALKSDRVSRNPARFIFLKEGSSPIPPEKKAGDTSHNPVIRLGGRRKVNESGNP
jgi:hypothetical protein